MKSIKVLFILFLMTLSHQVFALEKTEIIVYKPAIPAGEAKKGYCWTESLAVARPNTWRCMVGNEIQDPCFGTEDKNIVVCGVDPLKNDNGFAVQLTQPLPKSNDIVPSNQPWMFELEDETICTPFTGTLPFVDNQPVKFSCKTTCPDKQKCERMVGIFNLDTQGRVWLAKKVTYIDKKSEAVETVAVKTAWK
jgi:hypothetical protein